MHVRFANIHKRGGFVFVCVCVWFQIYSEGRSVGRDSTVDTVLLLLHNYYSESQNWFGWDATLLHNWRNRVRKTISGSELSSDPESWISEITKETRLRPKSRNPVIQDSDVDTISEWVLNSFNRAVVETQAGAILRRSCSMVRPSKCVLPVTLRWVCFPLWEGPETVRHQVQVPEAHLTCVASELTPAYPRRARPELDSQGLTRPNH